MDDLRRRIEDWTLGPVFPPLAALVSFLVAAAAALFPGEIGGATREFLQRLAAFDPGRPQVWVAAFWGMLGALASILYLRLRAEGWHGSERMRKMLQAVHRSPNPNVFVDYPRIFRQAEASVHVLAVVADEPAAARREAAIRSARGVLDRIVELARHFSQAPESNLRASIYLIADPAPDGGPYAAALVQRLRFFDRARHRLDGLRSLLYLPGDLSSAEDRGAAGDVRIALPVPHRAETPQGHRLALPGAPHALLTGEARVYEDTRASVGDWCSDLEKSVRDEIERFFDKGGDGRDIRSFVSLRLGHDADPVGVLNLESDRTRLLGPEPEYYVTFFALAEPLVRLLAAPVSAYAAAGRELGLLPDAPAPAAPPAESVGAEPVAAD